MTRSTKASLASRRSEGKLEDINISIHEPTEAARDLRENRSRFAQNVRTSMRGGHVGDEQFTDVRVKQ